MFAEPVSNSNSNELYSNCKLEDISIQKHIAGSMNARINYIKPKLIYLFRKIIHFPMDSC
jgi:hypothetical protein